MPSKKRKARDRPTIHPKNKYSENSPDFDLLASLYPSFQPFVFHSRDGRPRIDWTDYNATRELTRVLLLHDHGLNWWIPDGQLCPTVPNRSNYIHWIEDLLSSDIIPKTNSNVEIFLRGFDIGTGANCIYPLLGASLLGWSFVASDVTDVAIEWAKRNVSNNPHISELIDVRKVESDPNINLSESHDGASTSYYGPPILLGVVKEDEKFDFCMCNPPFFENMEEAGLNPKTCCGGTSEEMVCPGGEKAFIARLIEDSIILKQNFRWYTSMIGRKMNLKFLISRLREAGVSIVKTTEFVQGQTYRWGLAWSFVPAARKMVSPHVPEKSTLSFMLEGLQRQFSAFDVLQSVESFFSAGGALCKLNPSSFTIDVTVSNDHCEAILRNGLSYDSGCFDLSLTNLCFRVSVFQQIPGTLLVIGSLQHKDSQVSGAFSLILQRLEEVLKLRFCRDNSKKTL